MSLVATWPARWPVKEELISAVLKKLANGREFIEAARLAFSGTRCLPNPTLPSCRAEAASDRPVGSAPDLAGSTR